MLLFILFKVFDDFLKGFFGLFALYILPYLSFVLLIWIILLSSGLILALSIRFNCFLLFCFFSFSPFGFKISSRLISLVGYFLERSMLNFSNFSLDKEDFMFKVFLWEVESILAEKAGGWLWVFVFRLLFYFVLSDLTDGKCSSRIFMS